MAAHHVTTSIINDLTSRNSLSSRYPNSTSFSSMSSTSSLSQHFSGLSLSPSSDSSSFLGARLTTLGVESSSSASQSRPHIAPGSSVAGLGGVLGGLFKGSDPADKTRQVYADRVALINSLEPRFASLTDEQLKNKTLEFKSRVSAGETLDSILPEAFAVVREASKRVLGLRPFDVQLIGGMVLHKGEIAEMRTGEGKTLVSVLPAYLNALAQNGVQVVTVNDYLARRDCEWVGQVHRFLGLRVGLIQQGMESKERRENYACDVTYVTNSELGFDYLRDNLATSKEELVLRDFFYCIIDEVDSILIDEARTPLIISGSAERPSERYIKAAMIANAFARDVHYTVDEKQKSVQLTEEGYEESEGLLQVKDLYDPKEQWASYLLNAIKAKELFLKDVNYIVRDKEILIVDEFTGRVMQGRRWSDGLHQAIEAKEGVSIQNESVTLASISYQNFFLQFPKLCGMTGTAATESEEFLSIYKLKVTVIPTNRVMIRKDESDVVFRSENGKWRATVVEVARMHKLGRPVLVGTTSVEQSESLSLRLKENNIPHQVLNAKPENVEREAEIVSQSGRLGSVTIATNMAGRGTDIILGGNAEFMARLQLKTQLLPRIVQMDDSEIPFEGKKKALPSKPYKVKEEFFPCPLSKESQELIDKAILCAVISWGEKKLTKLDAEEKLSYACEKGPVQDEPTALLRRAFEKVNSEYKILTDQEKLKVVNSGGLHVIGTERHESRRIDNQLRGRSGRQGDPGSSRFFLSLEDNIFRIFGGDRIKGLMRAFRVEDLPIESKMLTKALDEAQRKVEVYFFEIRKQLFEYDQVLNSQRDRVYAERRRALLAEDLENQMLEYAELTMDDILEANIDPTQPEDSWNLEPLVTKVKQYCYLLDYLDADALKKYTSSYENLREFLRAKGREAYYQKRDEVEGEVPGLMRDAQKYFVLSQTDNLWKEHLQALKFVQQAVGLRGYAQKDPLIEYKLEGYNLFLDMMAQIRRNVIYSVYQFKAIKTPKSPVNSDEGDSSNAGESSQGQVVTVGSSKGGKKSRKFKA